MTADSSIAQTAIDQALIDNTLQRLRSLTQLDVRNAWRVHLGDLSTAVATDAGNWDGWAIAPQDERGYLMGSRGQQVRWLGQVITVPQALTADGWALAGLRLRFALGWWSENAQVYVNGNLVQEGDLFDCFCRIVLSDSVTIGDTWSVAIRLVSPGHDDGALVRSQLLFEPVDFDPHQLSPNVAMEPGFIADELETVYAYLKADIFPKFTLRSLEVAQRDFNQKIAYLNWSKDDDGAINVDRFIDSIQRIRLQMIQQGWSDCIKARKVEPVGHAHLDMVWLWPLQETYEVAEKTFESVLNLQKINQDLTFCHSSPALLEWLEINRPRLFEQIQESVKNGRFEIAAGLWIEPEFNLIRGEAIARQLLYGQRYVQEKFTDSQGDSVSTKIAWLPDSFGFCWQIPQLFKKAGIDYFLTQKLRWNDTTDFPHELFYWVAPDGTKILTIMMPPIGTDMDPVAIGKRAIAWETATGDSHPLWLPGVGDHGGGPSQDMLDVAHLWQRSPLFPEVSFTTAIDHCKSLEERLVKSEAIDTLPEWKDELYLEFHRGCYTTHSDQKLANRQCENLLFEAELWSSLCGIQGLATEQEIQINHEKLEAAWKKVLLNQFHDILPGSAVPEAYIDADRDWAFAKGTAQAVLQRSVERWAQSVLLNSKPSNDAVPYLIFNSVDSDRSRTVEIPIPNTKPDSLWKDIHKNWRVTDANGQHLNSQLICSREYAKEGDLLLLIELTNLSRIGYSLIYLQPVPDVLDELYDYDSLIDLEPTPEKVAKCRLSNKYIEAEIDGKTGFITKLIDKKTGENLIKSPSNQLQLFKDEGQYWDAWNIDPQYEDHLLSEPALVEIYWLGRGPVRQHLRVVYLWGESQFQHEYILDSTDSYLTVTTHIHWQERHVLVKAAVFLDESYDQATYQIPCGAIARPTRPKTDAEKAKWEVPALQWADLSAADNTGGLSILNNCKHGYDAKPGQLRLTLLRGTTWPNPDADKGYHCFTYALYPHAGSWQEANTVHHADCLNRPLRAVAIAPNSSTPKTQPAAAKLLTLGKSNLRLMTLKRSEDSAKHWIVHCHESHGEMASLENAEILGQPLVGNDCAETDLLEKSAIAVPEVITPWTVTALKFSRNID
ncbi:MAG: alpha-mannosidase [Cyanophyceae cyanobacterium]